MRTWTGFVCAALLSIGVTRAQGQSAAAPTVDATVATISGAGMSAAAGMQGIALNADRTLLYVGEGGRTAVWAPDKPGCHGGTTPAAPIGAVGISSTATRARVAELPLQNGTPIHAEIDSATGRIYIAASAYGVYAYEGTTQVGAVSLGAMPHDVGIDPTLGRGIVTNTFEATSQTHLTLIDLKTMKVISVVNTGGFGPHKAAVDPARHLAYITHAEFSKVDVIDMQTGQMLRQITTGLGQGGAQNAIDLTRRRLYTLGATSSGPGSESRLVAIDLATEQPVGGVTIPVGGHGSRVDPVTGQIWVVLEEQHQVSVIDPDTLTERARIPVGHCPYYLDIDPVRRLAYVTNQGDNTISVVDMTKVAGGASSLPAPASLTYTLTGGTISFTWPAVAGAASYDLEAGSAANLADLAVLNTTALGFTATAGPGTYYARVRAKSAAGASSNPSNEVVITVGGGGGCSAAPGPPTGLSASTAAGTIVLTWGGSVGSPTSYVIEAGSMPGLSNLANADLGSAATSYTASGVAPGTYYVRLRAKNSCGTSAASNEIVIVV